MDAADPLLTTRETLQALRDGTLGAHAASMRLRSVSRHASQRSTSAGEMAPNPANRSAMAGPKVGRCCAIHSPRESRIWAPCSVA